MTHTVADAEAAIARHPTDLTQLAMAADLLIEAGDPRGEDFAACLAGDLTGEELMRRHPADVSAMYVAAWEMSSNCGTCNGAGFYPKPDNPEWVLRCERCGGNYFREARAEALRLLAECGKVGEGFTGYFAYGSPKGTISGGWYREAIYPHEDNRLIYCQVIPERLALLDAYAKVDPDTRYRWAAETRALSVQSVEVMS